MHIELFENSIARIAIFDCPSNENLDFYKDFLESNNISNIVRLCPKDYLEERFVNFNFFELNYYDGSAPDEKILSQFDNIIKDVYLKDKKINLGIHCRAGLGRSSTLAAYILIKYTKMDSIDSVIFIRNKIPKAFNSMQLKYIDALKPEKKLDKKKFFGLF